MKTPSEEKFYTFNFDKQPAIEAGATIVDIISLEVTPTGEAGDLATSGESASGSRATFLATGGILGTLYTVDIKVLLSTDETIEDQALIRITSETPSSPIGPFSAQRLLEFAYARFGEEALQQRVAAGKEQSAKEMELLKIARSVISRVQGAAEQADSWPLPGDWPMDSVSPIDGETDISGIPFADMWPADLLQRALELFDWRTYQGLEVIPQAKVTMGKAAETYFFNVARGIEALTVGGLGEPTSGAPLASRDRSGAALLNDGSRDRRNVLDTFVGGAWDWS